MPSNNSNKSNNSNNKQSISAKLAELDEQTEWFYSDDFSLDEASEKYKAATKLAKDIEEDLNSLKNEIEIIDKDFSKE